MKNKNNILNRMSIVCLVMIMMCAAILQYSDWLHAQSTTPFKYIFEEKLDELLMISKLELKIEKSDKITITDVKYEEEVLSFNEVNNEFVFVKEFKENGTYEFVISYQEKIEKEVTEAESSKESKILKQAGIDKEPSVEDIPVDKVEEANKNILEKKIVEDWSETKTMNVEYKVKDIGVLVNVPVDKIEPIAPDKIETVDKEPVKPKEEPVIPKEEIPVEKEETVVPEEEAPVEKEEPVTPKEEPIEEVSKSCYEVNNGVIVGLRSVDHVGCENKGHLVLDIPSMIDGQNIIGIGKDAFINHTEITKVILPDSVIKIGEKAFAGTSSLLHMSIMGEIKEIHMTAFEGSSVKEIDVSHQYESDLLGSPWGASKEVKVTFKPVPQLAPPPVMNMPKAVNDQSTCFVVTGEEITGFEAIDHANCTNPEHKNVVIPASINGISITSIGQKAFFNCTSITSVTIPNSVTSIGIQAFSSCPSLTSVELPDNLTSMGVAIFQNCTSLTSITIPANVTRIAEQSFYGCTSLANVTLPNALIGIDYQAFFECSSLISLELSNNIESIGYGAFYKCISLTSINIPNKLTHLEQDTFRECKKLNNITIPESVTTIGNNAFNQCYELTSLVVPDTVTTIYNYAFSNCSKLETVKLSVNLKSIGAYLFSSCSVLKSIELPSGLETIGSYAFSKCVKLENISIPNTVTSIGDNAFSGCTTFTSISIPQSVENIGSNAFYGCTKLIKIHLPDSSYNEIKGTPWGASQNIVYWKNNESCFDMTSDGRIVGFKPFGHDGCLSDHSVANIPAEIDNKTVVGIYSRAFYNNSYVKKVVLPDTVTSIGDYAFYNNLSIMSGLNRSTIVIGPNVEKIAENAFSSYFIGKLDISSQEKDSILNAPWGANRVAEVQWKVTDPILPVENSAFGFGKVNTITHYGGSSYSYDVIIPEKYKDINNKDQDVLYIDPNVFSGDILNSIQFTSNSMIKKIGDGAFSNCGEAVTSILLPDSVVTIGNEVFTSNAGLEVVTLGIGVKSIGDGAFRGLSSLKTLSLNEGLETIGKNAFNGCTGLETIVIPDTVTSIGEGAFTGCTGLKNIIIGKGMTTVDNLGISSCTSLVSVSIMGNVSTLPNDLFNTSVEKLHLSSKTGNSVAGYPWGSTKGNKLRVYWQENGTCFDYKVTNGVGELLGFKPEDHSECQQGNVHTLANIPETITSGGVTTTITSIASKAFYADTATDTMPWQQEIANVKNLYEVIVPATVTSVGDKAFYHEVPSKLETIRFLGSGTLSLPNILFDSNRSDRNWTIYLEERTYGSVSSAPWNGGQRSKVHWKPNVDNSCFYISGSTLQKIAPVGHKGCQNEGHKHMVIPDSIINIGANAFEYVEEMVTCTLPANLKTIGMRAFSGCSGLKDVTIPSTLTTIGREAFVGCRSFEKIVLPNSMTSLGEYAFSSCTNVTEIVLGSGIQTIPKYAFTSLKLLTSITIPANVTSIAENTFTSTPLEDIYIGDKPIGSIKNAPWGSSNGGNTRVHWLDTKDTSCYWIDAQGIVLGFKPLNHTGCSSTDGHTHVNIPSTITGVDNTTIEIKGIGVRSFANLNSIKSVKLPDSVTSVPSYAFNSCQELVDVQLPDTINEIEGFSFSGCYKLKNINIPNAVEGIMSSAFYNCKVLSELKLPSQLKTIGPNAFDSCYSLKSVTIPDNVTIIYNMAFRNCVALTSVKLSENLVKLGTSTVVYSTNSDGVFYNCASLESIVIPDTVTTIAADNFGNCKKLKEVVVGEGIKELPKALFRSCTTLEKITFKSSVSIVQDAAYPAFKECTRLKEIIYDTTITTLDASYDLIKKISSVSIIRFPKLSRYQVLNLNEYPFGSSEKEPALYFKNNGTYFDSDADGLIYTKPSDHADMLTLDKMETLTNLTIPEIVDGKTVKGLGNSLVNYFTQLEEITYEGTTLKTTGNDYFNIPSLRRIVFNKTMTSFTSPEGTGGPLFLSEVKDIYFNENTLGSIGDANTMAGKPYTNWGRNGDMRTHFKEDNNDDECFYVDGGTIIGIKPSNHERCTQQNDHTYLDVPKSIGGNSITKIKDYAFSSYGMNGIFEAIGLPNSLTEIGAHAFEGCSKLTGIDVPNSVTTIGNNAFAFSGIQSITFGTDLITIGSHILDDVTLYSAINLGENVQTVPIDAFSGLTMKLYDWEGNPTVPRVQINKIENTCGSFSSNAPWGLPQDPNNKPEILYKGYSVFIDASTAYETDRKEGTIDYTITPEDGGIVKELVKPDGSETKNLSSSKLVDSFNATLNSQEYNSGKGYVIKAKSGSGKTSTRTVLVNGIVYINMSASSFEIYDFNAEDLTLDKIKELSGAQATKISNSETLNVTVKTPLVDIQKALMSQVGEATVDLEATCQLRDEDYSKDINYTKTVSIRITSKSGDVSAKDHVMKQEDTKNVTDMKEFKNIVSTSTTITTNDASSKLYTTMNAKDFENFKSGEVGEYTVTSHLGRVTCESKVKVVKDGSNISSDGLSSVYGHDIDLGLSGASKYTEAQLLGKIKPEYEQPGVEKVTDIIKFSIPDITDLKNVAIGTPVELTVKHTQSGVEDTIIVTIVDDSPSLLVEIPQEVVLDKYKGEQGFTATGEGTIKLVASNEHLSDLDIDIKTEANVELKYIKDLSKKTNVNVYKSDGVIHDGQVLMTLNSSTKKSDTFKLKLPMTAPDETEIPRGMFEGKMNFTIGFK